MASSGVMPAGSRSCTPLTHCGALERARNPIESARLEQVTGQKRLDSNDDFKWFKHIEFAERTGRLAPMTAGITFALAAGLAWGLVFICPLLLPDYPPLWLSLGRYLAFGLIALPLAWIDRRGLARLQRADWIEALKLAAIGNLLYYLCLSAAIQCAGAPMPTMIIGTLPVVIPVVANLRARRMHHRVRVQSRAVQARHAQPPHLLRSQLTDTAPQRAPDPPVAWRRLLVPLLLIATGIALVNDAELRAHGRTQADAVVGTDALSGLGRQGLGALLAVGALICWTWYPMRNAEWMRFHARCTPRAWATAQGVATLPLSLIGFVVVFAMPGAGGEDFSLPLGPRPAAFVATMFAIGLVASWLGTLCWNAASARLPATSLGPLIIFETLSALAYAFVLRGAWPSAGAAIGIASMSFGVLLAMRKLRSGLS